MYKIYERHYFFFLQNNICKSSIAKKEGEGGHHLHLNQEKLTHFVIEQCRKKKKKSFIKRCDTLLLLTKAESASTLVH